MFSIPVVTKQFSFILLLGTVDSALWREETERVSRALNSDNTSELCLINVFCGECCVFNVSVVDLFICLYVVCYDSSITVW